MARRLPGELSTSGDPLCQPTTLAAVTSRSTVRTPRFADLADGVAPHVASLDEPALEREEIGERLRLLLERAVAESERLFDNPYGPAGTAVHDNLGHAVASTGTLEVR